MGNIRWIHVTRLKLFHGNEEEGYKIASVRIHVERAISRMKYFNILKFLENSLLNKIDKILICIAFTCNNFPDLIQEDENKL